MLKLNGVNRATNNFSIMLNIKTSNKKKINKTNTINLDFPSSPIKNTKKIIKRNTRTNSYNSFSSNQTEGIVTNFNAFTSGIVSLKSNSKILLKKNTFSLTNKNLFTESCQRGGEGSRNKRVKPAITQQTESNWSKRFTPSKKRNYKSGLRNNFQHSYFLKSSDFNKIGVISDNCQQLNKDPNKLLTHHNSKNKLLLSSLNCPGENNKSKAFSKKNISVEPVFQESKNNIDFININKARTNKSKAGKKIRYKINHINKKIANILELSSDDNQLGFLNEFEMLYNNLKKRVNPLKGYSSIKKTYSNEKRGKNFCDRVVIDQSSISNIIRENQLVKQKNEELTLKFDEMKLEFEQMKKNNREIKEDLKEKSKFLKDMKLTIDIFSQELSKLQNLFYTQIDNENKNCNSNTNITASNINTNNNLELSRIEKMNILSDDKIHSGISYSLGGIKTEPNALIRNKEKNKIEKIYQLQLPLKNITSSQRVKNSGGSFESTSKNVNKETKDTLEKDVEERNEKNQSCEQKEKEEEEDESIDLTNIENISLAENLNINETAYKYALNKNNNKLDTNRQFTRNNFLQENNTLKTTQINKNKVFTLPKKLNFIKKEEANDFNEEFLKCYDKFSDSWRKEVDKMLKKGTQSNIPVCSKSNDNNNNTNNNITNNNNSIKNTNDI